MKEKLDRLSAVLSNQSRPRRTGVLVEDVPVFIIELAMRVVSSAEAGGGGGLLVADGHVRIAKEKGSSFGTVRLSRGAGGGRKRTKTRRSRRAIDTSSRMACSRACGVACPLPSIPC